MRSLFYLLLFILAFCHLNSASATCSHRFDPKCYLYNEEGYPLFVKVYVEPSLQSIHSDSSSRGEGKAQFLTLMTQNDRDGAFIVVPIKKKKSRNDDEEEDTWQCPYCDTINEASRNTCKNPECILYRKPGRDWFDYLEL